MPYTVKWIEDNMGITRKALRNYEEKGLMPKNGSRNPKTNYREYDDEDIALIQRIRIIQGIGFTVNEIKAMMDEESDVDYYAALGEKVKELKRKRDEIDKYLGYAKTIKLTGRVYMPKQPGSRKCDEFNNEIREKWDLTKDPTIGPFVDMIAIGTDPNGIDPEEIDTDRLEEMAEIITRISKDSEVFIIHGAVDAHYKILGKLQELGSSNTAVQIIVKSLYDILSRGFAAEKEEGSFNYRFFARYTVDGFIPGCDLYVDNENKYGAEACRFIAESIAYFGGFSSIEEFIKEGHE